MSAIYDNWERLVAAVLKKQQLWHENVASLRAYYCSEDERLVLYDYYRKGSVYALLHDLLKHPTIKDQMVKMFQIGLRCVEKSIKKRPQMSEVVKMLEQITMLNPISRARASMELIFVGDFHPTFDRKNVLRSAARVLGKGTFGTSYLAILESGNIITVKRLRNVVVTFDDFQHHMEVIGRMHHENIAVLRAYTFHYFDKLLLYDYYNQFSVSALLHGEIVTHKTSLDWETRLKISVGAARGIAHIHKQDGQKLVHGNIKSSNIFLNEQKYGIVCDAGLAKLTAPITRSRMPTPDYCAPEVTDTSNISQASDVYSFGVLLLELLSGKPSQIMGDDGKLISLGNWIQSVARDEWISQVFDVDPLKYEIEEETKVHFLQIAMDCVSSVPERRPRMSEIVKMLEEISGIEPSEDQPSIESRLEDLLEDMLPTLAP